MQEVAIGTARRLDAIKQRLDYEFEFLKEEGINIKTREINRGNLKFLGCSLQRAGRDRFSPEDATAIMKQFIANALSDVIVNDLERGIVRTIIRNDHAYLTKEDQEKLYDQVMKIMNGEVEGRKDLFFKMYRKNKILGKILEYLESNRELVLEGFVRFRLKDYKEELEETVDRVAEDFLIEREYSEFVKLLKYYVELQPPVIDEIHVLPESGGKYALVDCNGMPIHSIPNDVTITGPDGELEYGDLLISALVTLAPRTVIVHTQPEKLEEATLNILTEVFAERLRFI
ncbi:MAG TPA: putative sporulation protein YtxC [Firmicutes bacterium]|nr:putative sporulation protein YtxC [Bacillota bacterium]